MNKQEKTERNRRERRDPTKNDKEVLLTRSRNAITV